jgi:holin-like protein
MRGGHMMNVIRTIVQIGIIILFYLMGEAIVKVTGIIIPGSIIGLVLLWFALFFKVLNVRYIQKGASFLLAFLTLFFIPSTVAVINYPELLTVSGLLLILAVIVSTIFALVVTGKISKYIEVKEQRMKEEGDVDTTSANSVHRH